MNNVPLFNHIDVERNGGGKNGHSENRAPEAPYEPGAEEVGHVDRIARTDSDFLQLSLLYNSLLSEAWSIQAIYAEASSWVGVFPAIHGQISHKKDIDEG